MDYQWKLTTLLQVVPTDRINRVLFSEWWTQAPTSWEPEILTVFSNLFYFSKSNNISQGLSLHSVCLTVCRFVWRITQERLKSNVHVNVLLKHPSTDNISHERFEVWLTAELFWILLIWFHCKLQLWVINILYLNEV